VTRPCGGASHARMGGGRRTPRCRGGGQVLPCPIDHRPASRSGVVSFRARGIFLSSFVVGRAWCLARAALLLAAAECGRARCVRCAVRRVSAFCSPVAAAGAAAADSRRLSRRAGPARRERGSCACARWAQRGVVLFSCKRGAVPWRKQRAHDPPIPVLEMQALPQAVVAVAAAVSPIFLRQ